MSNNNKDDKIVEFLTKALIVIICICFGALVAFSAEPFKAMDNPQHIVIAEISERGTRI